MQTRIQLFRYNVTLSKASNSFQFLEAQFQQNKFFGQLQASEFESEAEKKMAKQTRLTAKQTRLTAKQTRLTAKQNQITAKQKSTYSKTKSLHFAEVTLQDSCVNTCKKVPNYCLILI